MIENQKAEKAIYASQQAAHALTATTTKNPNPPDQSISTTAYCGRGRGRGGRGRGRGRRGRSQQPHGAWTSPTTYTWTLPAPWNPPTQPPTAANSSWLQWAPPPPPCPYPTTSPQSSAKPGQGILGPGPNQAHQASTVPTDIQQVLYTMSLNPPSYNNGVMDTSATISMDRNAGNFHTIFNNGMNENIIVGDGTNIPVLGHGPQTFPPPYPPFTLNRVLYAPNLIRKLISVRQFTKDNSVSVEFDPFGFIVKDYKTRAPIIQQR
ncbi:uncharacterized protein LOC110869461 [Helianthus annuus]|uniref:uncharacterized protein LOC110869461 n=1 Tax=Helianthus annuus TaxID=4232 RepID=UPI000B8F3376|nr:uncharacterized protein LOC110869461 [Helianthus annuus]